MPLEEPLNDLAVIRTAFETMELFPDDRELQLCMRALIADARANLVHRLKEFRTRAPEGQSSDLGCDLGEFRNVVVRLATRGTSRRALDELMKVVLFQSVSAAESATLSTPSDPIYRYPLPPEFSLQELTILSPVAFAARLLDDLFDTILDDENYTNQRTFEKHPFQKYIAFLFAIHAATDPPSGQQEKP